MALQRRTPIPRRWLSLLPLVACASGFCCSEVSEVLTPAPVTSGGGSTSTLEATSSGGASTSESTNGGSAGVTSTATVTGGSGGSAGSGGTGASGGSGGSGGGAGGAEPGNGVTMIEAGSYHSCA